MSQLSNASLVKLVLVVQDIERKLDGFCSLFPLERPRVTATEGAPLAADSKTHTTYRGKRITGRVKMASLKMGSVTLELIEPLDYDSPWAEYARRHGEGIFSIVYTVGEFEKESRMLEDSGHGRYHLGEYGSGRYAYFDTEQLLGITLCLQNLTPAS